MVVPPLLLWPTWRLFSWPSGLSQGACAADGVGDGDDFHFGPVLPDQVQFVNHRVKAVIVGAQRLQHLPHHFVGLVVVQRFVLAPRRPESPPAE
jgi:hypothetical protein